MSTASHSRHIRAAILGGSGGSLLLLAVLTLVGYWGLDLSDAMVGFGILVGGFFGVLTGSGVARLLPLTPTEAQALTPSAARERCLMA